MSEPIAYRTPSYPKLDADRMRGRAGKKFLSDPDLLAAANVALCLEMPLLLTGEAGCGKTDFAFAAATGLVDDVHVGPETREPLQEYVRSDTRARDLLYSYDQIRRFGDSQIGGAEDKRRAAYPQNYITLEALGAGLVSKVRRVVLIDEIDKAPRDLPNDLLRELDQGWFEIPEIPNQGGSSESAISPGHERLARVMRRPEGIPKPLVVITSNVERQLPDAFLRRCVFYYIPFPDRDRLREILSAFFAETDPSILDNTVTLLQEVRRIPGVIKKPATAELINWVFALLEVFDRADITRRLAAAVEALGKGELAEWRSLPALGCLLKLREDLGRVEATA